MQSRIAQLLVATGFAMVIPVSLQAATFTPNVLDDPAPVAAPNGCTGQGSNPTRCSLREAALSANASAGNDIIQLGEGTYTLSIPNAGNPESGDLDFVEGVDYGITIQGQGPDKTKILAAPGLNDRIMELLGDSANMTLQGITFEGGNADGDGGGAVRYSISTSDPNTVNVLNCNFVNNHADGSGGAIYQSSGSPIINFDGGTYDNNSSDTNGGAIYLSHGGSINPDSLKNLILTNNEALSGDGGAVYQSASTGMAMSNIQATGNRAESAGALFVGNGGNPGLELSDGILSGNTATNGNGGGLVVSSSGLIKIVNTTFSNNEVQGSPGDGGGASLSNGGGLQILNSTFSGNTANGIGGGLSYSSSSGGTLNEITNSTFSGNTANGTGGGGLFTDHTLAVSLNNVTIADNTSAGVGGGAWGTNIPVILRNTIFSGNDSAGQTDDCAGVFTSDGYNIFGSPNDGDCEPDGQNVGFNATDIVGDALIGPLADNGGPTQTHNLLAGSPAIDGGDPSGCLDGEGAILTTDQRGLVRPSGAECDIGAVEAAVTDLAIVKTSDDEIYVVGDEITYTLTVTNNGASISPALVSDDLPAGVSFLSVDSGCTESSGLVSCDLGNLDPGASAAVTVVVEAIDDGDIDNTATVSGADIDTDPANNSSTVSVSVLGDSPDDGGCSIGASTRDGSLAGWSLLGFGLISALLLRRRLI